MSMDATYERVQIKTPFGWWVAGLEGDVVVCAEFVDTDPAEAAEAAPRWLEDALLGSLEGGVVAEPRLRLRGSAFQLAVWERLRRLPFGSTVAYGELARELGKPGSARAVGSAVAANPIAWWVPCHRVVPATGGCGGFRWGVQRKAALLAAERVVGGGRA
jgi:AraC family transcriptional regulator of adaptative response/methylated-DNA-[protein]-cysteine methyltransferase